MDISFYDSTGKITGSAFIKDDLVNMVIDHSFIDMAKWKETDRSVSVSQMVSTRRSNSILYKVNMREHHSL